MIKLRCQLQLHKSQVRRYSELLLANQNNLKGHLSSRYLNDIQTMRNLDTVLNIANLSFQQIRYPQPAETHLFNLLKRIRTSENLAHIESLKHIWDNHFQSYGNGSLQDLYYSTVIHILLNCNEYLMAKDLFMKVYNIENKNMPTLKLILCLMDFKDYDGICDILPIINSNTISEPLYSALLSMAVDENHYRLVQVIFDTYLMSPSDSLVDINTSLIHATLNVLCLHGDVTRSLKLIEAIKEYSFESLTKELSLKVIEAYCYYDNNEHTFLDPHEYQNYHDTSVERVLDVLGTIMNKSNFILTYKDVSQFLSHRFMNYRTYDENIALKSEKARQLEKLNDVSKRVNNDDLKPFAQGNVLSNLKILSLFTKKHVSYMVNHDYSCIGLFINCMLNHINLYQNFSGISRLLTELSNLNPDFHKQWLDHDLFNIIINSLRHSQAKMSSLYLFEYLKSIKFKFSEDNYYAFVESSLRGDFKQQLVYYLFHYYQDYDKIGSRTLDLLKGIPPELMPSTEQIKSMPSKPEITDAQHDQTRKYNYTIDKRDVTYIKYIFKPV